MFLKNSTNITWKHVLEPLFNKVSGLTPVTLLKKRLQHRYFPVNFKKILRTSFLQNTFMRLLLFVICLTVSFHNEILYICSKQTFFCQKNQQNSQFCYLFILQIHFILSVVNAFYRPKHKNINTRNPISLMR